jgi:hypothetical protein
VTYVITVPSSRDGEHTIRKAGDAWVCSCRDHVFRANGEEYACKHLAELALSMAEFVAGARKSKSAQRVLRRSDAIAPEVPRFEDLELPADEPQA